MKFSLKINKIKPVFLFSLILGLVFSLFITSNVSNLGANSAMADTPSNTSNTGYDGTFLVAAVNPDLNPTNDRVLPVSDNTISPDINSCISATSTNSIISTYVVRPGDTLSEIASLFGVSVNTIILMNDGVSRSSPLQTGQTLLILPISGIQYIVKPKDTIQGIATHFGVDVDQILQYNDITSSTILNPGDTVIIPDATFDGPQNVSVPSVKKITKKPGIGTPGSNPAHNTNGPSYPGYYSLPLAHGEETQGLHGYNAVDLGDPTGTPILAAANGVVIISLKNGGWNGGYGNYVVISHPNGTQTLYAHMSKNFAYDGEFVVKGQEIGLVGRTGEATGPHLHFEVRGARNPFADVGTF